MEWQVRSLDDVLFKESTSKSRIESWFDALAHQGSKPWTCSLHPSLPDISSTAPILFVVGPNGIGKTAIIKAEIERIGAQAVYLNGNYGKNGKVKLAERLANWRALHQPWSLAGLTNVHKKSSNSRAVGPARSNKSLPRIIVFDELETLTAGAERTGSLEYLRSLCFDALRTVEAVVICSASSDRRWLDEMYKYLTTQATTNKTLLEKSVPYELAELAKRQKTAADVDHQSSSLQSGVGRGKKKVSHYLPLRVELDPPLHGTALSFLKHVWEIWWPIQSSTTASEAAKTEALDDIALFIEERGDIRNGLIQLCMYHVSDCAVAQQGASVPITTSATAQQTDVSSFGTCQSKHSNLEQLQKDRDAMRDYCSSVDGQDAMVDRSISTSTAKIFEVFDRALRGPFKFEPVKNNIVPNDLRAWIVESEYHVPMRNKLMECLPTLWPEDNSVNLKRLKMAAEKDWVSQHERPPICTALTNNPTTFIACPCESTKPPLDVDGRTGPILSGTLPLGTDHPLVETDSLGLGPLIKKPPVKRYSSASSASSKLKAHVPLKVPIVAPQTGPLIGKVPVELAKSTIAVSPPHTSILTSSLSPPDTTTAFPKKSLGMLYQTARQDILQQRPNEKDADSIGAESMIGHWDAYVQRHSHLAKLSAVYDSWALADILEGEIYRNNAGWWDLTEYVRIVYTMPALLQLWRIQSDKPERNRKIPRISWIKSVSADNKEAAASQGATWAKDSATLKDIVSEWRMELSEGFGSLTNTAFPRLSTLLIDTLPLFAQLLLSERRVLDQKLGLNTQETYPFGSSGEWYRSPPATPLSSSSSSTRRQLKNSLFLLADMDDDCGTESPTKENNNNLTLEITDISTTTTVTENTRISTLPTTTTTSPGGANVNALKESWFHLGVWIHAYRLRHPILDILNKMNQFTKGGLAGSSLVSTPSLLQAPAHSLILANENTGGKWASRLDQWARGEQTWNETMDMMHGHTHVLQRYTDTESYQALLQKSKPKPVKAAVAKKSGGGKRTASSVPKRAAVAARSDLPAFASDSSPPAEPLHPLQVPNKRPRAVPTKKRKTESKLDDEMLPPPAKKAAVTRARSSANGPKVAPPKNKSLMNEATAPNNLFQSSIQSALLAHNQSAAQIHKQMQ